MSAPELPASVVVLAFNSAATLGACLSSLQPQVEEIGAELIVVDNASADASVDVAARHATRVVRSDTNLGFAGGCNLGVANSRGRVVVLVNPDTELDPGCLSALVAVADDGLRGPVGGRARDASGSFDPRCTLGRPRLRGAVSFALGLDTMFRGSRWFDPEFGPMDMDRSAGIVEAEAVSGALLAVDRRLWDQLRGLDESFFLYGEDVDLCVRATAVGRRPAVVTHAGYTHVGGMSADGTIARRILLHRGKVTLYRRHLWAPAATAAILALQTGALLRGLPALLPVQRLSSRAEPWLELFRHRRDWRTGYLPTTAEDGTTA